MERDDIIEYSLDTHHSEEEGAKMRKKIWFVTALLTVITGVEVALGSIIKQDSPSWPFWRIACPGTFDDPCARHARETIRTERLRWPKPPWLDPRAGQPILCNAMPFQPLLERSE